MLAPAPNTGYGNVVPMARDTQTGFLRPTMPNVARTWLQGLVIARRYEMAVVCCGTGAHG
jgi:hypothetical protein